MDAGRRDVRRRLRPRAIGAANANNCRESGLMNQSINAKQMLAKGRQIFRSDTFGDEAFWGDTLKLHKAVERFHLARRWRWA